jgi:hypothetical protein
MSKASSTPRSSVTALAVAGCLRPGGCYLLDECHGGVSGEGAGRVAWWEHRYGSADSFQFVGVHGAECIEQMFDGLRDAGP